MQETIPTPPFLKKQLIGGITPATLLLLALMSLSLGLHLYNIQSIGDSNAYYTAAVEAMTQSWHNFFFVAAEPGGSVTVDKPPLGLWIEAVFAFFLGVSGFSTALPNILAGVLGLPILYHLVKKYAGELAGLVAALVMTLTPVYLATNRNNTMDGMLVFFLLLAAWAFMKATETGKLHWLLIGGIIVGLGFNIKMAQAFLPLPAFYALYFLCAKTDWLRKLAYLAITTALMLLISLAWAVIVDLIPADARPFIGSSKDNSVISLMLEHNGGSRLANLRQGNAPRAASSGGQNQPPQNLANPGKAPQQALDACANLPLDAACSFTLPNGDIINGTCITPPHQNFVACAPQGQPRPQPNPAGVNNTAPNNRGNTPFANETGEPGIWRFFISPLSRQMSWLLPFALVSMVLTVFGARMRLPVESGIHQALILWGGWLATCVIFFSMISGIFHSYYAIMLVPPLGAMVGVGVALLWSWSADTTWGSGIALGAVILTLAFQTFAVFQYAEQSLWMFAAALPFAAGIMLFGFNRRAANLLALSAMLVVPAYWTFMTVSANADQNLPGAYTGAADQSPRMRNIQRASNLDEKLLGELQANTQDMKYLLAVPSAQQGAEIVLATGRPVLYMGGFSGQDDVVSVDDLRSMVANGELRYILYGGERGNKPEISAWLQSSCVNMIDFAQSQPDGRGDALFLYRCE